MNNYWLAAPEMFLAGAICVVLLVDVYLPREQRQVTYLLAMLALVGASATSIFVNVSQPMVTFSGSFITDPAGGALKLLAYFVVALVFLYSRNFLEEQDLFKGEFFVLSLFGLLGIMVMISAHSMLTMYLGLELMSLSLYALVAFNRDSATAAESAMKYFVLGAIASGTLLYGISLLYGVTGTVQFSALAAAFSGTGVPGRAGVRGGGKAAWRESTTVPNPCRARGAMAPFPSALSALAQQPQLWDVTQASGFPGEAERPNLAGP